VKQSTSKNSPPQPAQNNRRLRRAARARARHGVVGCVELTPDPRAQAQGPGGLFVPSMYVVNEGGDK